MTRTRFNTPTMQQAVLIMLIVGWLGMWGTWVPSPVMALRLNAFDLAEWATVLMPVRLGEMRYIPDLLRLALAFCTIALALKAGDVHLLWLRWGMRAVALIAVALLIPQYPFWFASEYRMRFVVAIIGLIGIAISFVLDRWESVRRGLITVMVVAAAALAIYSFSVLNAPFSAHYGEAIQPGWGLLLFAGLLAIVGVFEATTALWPFLASRIKQTPEMQNGPAS